MHASPCMHTHLTKLLLFEKYFEILGFLSYGYRPESDSSVAEYLSNLGSLQGLVINTETKQDKVS